MKYVLTESQLGRIKEYFDPLLYLKKIMSDAPKYIRDPNTLKYDVAFQKVVDVIFKYTMKHSPVDNLKGVEVTKVTPQGWGSDMKDDSKGSHTEWIVLLNPKLPKWFNPDDIDYRTQLEDFKKEFASIANMMGLTSTSPISQEGYPFDKVKFIISTIGEERNFIGKHFGQNSNRFDKYPAGNFHRFSYLVFQKINFLLLCDSHIIINLIIIAFLL